ncbi:hypothetical protein ANO11243_002650 [Dothideomycetidae sp. 11243]|nr:hypothetical protein ANO11243_002650 [fungal sp. No.11243]
MLFVNLSCLLAALPVLCLAAPQQQQQQPNAAPAVEPEDFDVVAALQDQGVDVSALPLAQLANLSARSESWACALACSSLEILYGRKAVTQAGNAVYTNITQHGYWSLAQSSATPACLFQPSTAGQVSVLVLVSRLTTCPFAVRSGGHASFPAASSITDGITVSLDNLNSINLSGDHSIVSVGAGNKWGAVYQALDPLNLTVTGGRNSDVGVGGLTLGGGISFFSNLYGWACDNVASYQVVTACGSVVTASENQNSDLYFALRGGGNNFGIVTNFNFYTYSLPNGTMWGGTKIYTEQNFPAVVHAFTEISNNAESDLNAGTWVTWVSLNGTKIAGAELWYAKQNGTNATIFDNFRTIPAIVDGTKNQPVLDYTAHIASEDPYGFRQYFYVMTIKNDETLNGIAKDIFFDEIAAFDVVPGMFATATCQSITIPQIRQMSKRGGNPLGLDPSDGPLTLILLNPQWTGAQYDEIVYTAGSNVLSRIKAEAEARNLASNYLYMNYASQYQDVVASYGDDNKQRLIQIAQRYDPQGVFQNLSPGYFKLDRAPVPGTAYFSF